MSLSINAELGNCALCDSLCRRDDVIHAMLEVKDSNILITETTKCSSDRPMKVNASYEQLECTDSQPEIKVSLGPASDFRRRKLKCYPTFCFHDFCWAILLKTLNHPPIRACYDITLAINKRYRLRLYRTTPRTSSVFYKPHIIERSYQIYLSQSGPLCIPSLSERECLDILLSIRHLPYELRIQIWGYLNSSDLAARALVVLLRLSDLIHLEDRHCHGPSSKIHLGDLELSSYRFSTTGAVFQCIHVEPLGIATCRGKVVVSTAINTAELINNGSAIRFYKGEDKTDWLGKVPLRPEDCWYRFIHNTENSGLLYIEGRDRITKIGFENENNMVISKQDKRSSRHFGSDFEWQPPLSRSEVYPEESYFNHESFDMCMPRRYNTKVRHVRFQRGGYRLDRITMFLKNGISGIECVFQNNNDADVYDTQFTGQQSPHTWSLQLDQNEAITHVWVAREFEHWATLQESFIPGRLGLYLGTSFGRVESFNDTKYRDIHCLTSQKHGLVTGIYWNNSYSYGVTFSGKPHIYPHIPNPSPDLLPWTKT